MTRALTWMCGAMALSIWMVATSVAAQEPTGGPPKGPPPAGAEETKTEAPLWHYGAYMDLSYDVNFNFPSNHLFRNRTTAYRTNELAPNMALVYVRKDATSDSRWGTELGVQGGYDTVQFAFLQGEPKVGGSDTLRHFSRANVSYLAPVGGRELTVTAGLFNSLIGYESLYAKDNFSYTRSWMADNTPYMMFGVNARYPVSDEFAVTLFVINAYYHLAHPNDQPSYGGRTDWKPTSRLTVSNTLYYGPDQARTSLEFWRLYSNNIVEWKGDDLTVALSYDFGTENVAGQPGNARAFVTAGALESKWHVAGPWSVALRPEFYWDRNGRWTGSQQLVKAVSSTLEYKAPYRWTNSTLRLEYRYDDSTGKQGGFFTGSEISPGVLRLTPGQHLLILGLLWTFDSP